MTEALPCKAQNPAYSVAVFFIYLYLNQCIAIFF